MTDPVDHVLPHTAVVHDDDSDQDIWGGLPIKRLILESDNFIVFIDDDGEIDWRTDGYDWSKVDLGKFDAILNRAAALETIRRDGIDAGFTDNHKRLVAEGIARAFDGDLAAAQAMLNLAEEILNAKSREVARLWYLNACFVTVIPFVAMVAVLWIFRQAALPRLGETLFWMLLGSASGACGALLSILIRSSEIKCDLASGKTLHFAEAASRILAGAIARRSCGACRQGRLAVRALGKIQSRQSDDRHSRLCRRLYRALYNILHCQHRAERRQAARDGGFTRAAALEQR